MPTRGNCKVTINRYYSSVSTGYVSILVRRAQEDAPLGPPAQGAVAVAGVGKPVPIMAGSVGDDFIRAYGANLPPHVALTKQSVMVVANFLRVEDAQSVAVTEWLASDAGAATAWHASLGRASGPVAQLPWPYAEFMGYHLGALKAVAKSDFVDAYDRQDEVRNAMQAASVRRLAARVCAPALTALIVCAVFYSWVGPSSPCCCCTSSCRSSFLLLKLSPF